MTQRILVVDDEPAVRECVQDLLAMLPGCEVEGSGTFTEGRTKARQDWDLVISDYALPDGDGVDLLSACAEDHPATPRLLMSSHENDPKVQAALERRAVHGFIAKPIDPGKVLDRVGLLLGGPGQP